MKKTITYLTLFTLIFSQIGYSNEDSCSLEKEEPCGVPEDSEAYYTDEDDAIFNQGNFVGNQSNDYLRAQRWARAKNWALAIGTTAIGVTTLILVSKNQ